MILNAIRKNTTSPYICSPIPRVKKEMSYEMHFASYSYDIAFVNGQADSTNDSHKKKGCRPNGYFPLMRQPLMYNY